MAHPGAVLVQARQHHYDGDPLFPDHLVNAPADIAAISRRPLSCQFEVAAVQHISWRCVAFRLEMIEFALRIWD